MMKNEGKIYYTGFLSSKTGAWSYADSLARNLI
jgi:hypothetical protein